MVKTSSMKSTAAPKFILDIGDFSKWWLFIQEFRHFYSNYTYSQGSEELDFDDPNGHLSTLDILRFYENYEEKSNKLLEISGV